MHSFLDNVHLTYKKGFVILTLLCYQISLQKREKRNSRKRDNFLLETKSRNCGIFYLYIFIKNSIGNSFLLFIKDEKGVVKNT